MKTKVSKKTLGMKSFEYSEGQRVCEGFADYMLYGEGLGHINGAYSEAEIYDCDDEFAYIECKTGEQDMGDGHSNEYKSQHQISREILRSNKSLKDKIQAITEKGEYED